MALRELLMNKHGGEYERLGFKGRHGGKGEKMEDNFCHLVKLGESDIYTYNDFGQSGVIKLRE